MYWHSNMQPLELKIYDDSTTGERSIDSMAKYIVGGVGGDHNAWITMYSRMLGGLKLRQN